MSRMLSRMNRPDQRVTLSRYPCLHLAKGDIRALEKGAGFDRAAKLAAIPAGESPANRRSPVTVVVISSNGEGDRSVESLEVKVPEGWTFQSDPYRGASNLAGRSGSEPVKPRNLPPA